MSARALKLFRNTIALEKDEEQVIFINMRIKALWECLDQDEEVGAHITDTERFQPASREHIPLLAGEPRELNELDDELTVDFTIAKLTGKDNAQIVDETSLREDDNNDVHELIAM